MRPITVQVRQRAALRSGWAVVRRAILVLALSVLSGAALAQAGGEPAPADPSSSFEAALKAYCPAKNLEFLDPPLLARSIREYVQMLPQEQRDRVIKASSGTIQACAKDDLRCAINTGLTALRGERLAEGLARVMCALPYTCHDWSQCDKPANTAALPELARPSAPEPAQPNSTQPEPTQPEPTPSDEPAAREVPAPPPSSAPGLAEGERGESQAGDMIERPPRPASPRDAVIGFYEALGRGDGIAAEWFVVREKRGTGHFMASSMERFYGGLSEPLSLLGVEEIGPMEFQVRYRFTPRAGPVCNGTSIVRVRSTPEGYRVAGIDAPSGC